MNMRSKVRGKGGRGVGGGGQISPFDGIPLLALPSALSHVKDRLYPYHPDVPLQVDKFAKPCTRWSTIPAQPSRDTERREKRYQKS